MHTLRHTLDNLKLWLYIQYFFAVNRDVHAKDLASPEVSVAMKRKLIV